jgi:predicted DNA-binding transcriptional regulator YafY
MSTRGTIQRYMLILEKVISRQCPSFDDLHEHLSHEGYVISKRTLQRDLGQMREEFGIEISYNRARNGYQFEKDGQQMNDMLLRFMELLQTAQLLTENLKDDKELLQYVLFEQQGGMRGTEHLRLLLHAIRKRHKVVFEHENYHTGLKTAYLVSPYLLKEYQGRWYLVALPGSINAFRTFGLDRIRDLEVKKETFRRQASPDPRLLFDDVIGLVYSEDTTEEVTILVDELQVKYLATLPLHHSQKIQPSKNGEFLVTIHVKPNYELLQRILMLGEHAEVLGPASLRKEVCELLKSMAGYYKK